MGSTELRMYIIISHQPVKEIYSPGLMGRGHRLVSNPSREPFFFFLSFFLRITRNPEIAGLVGDGGFREIF